MTDKDRKFVRLAVQCFGRSFATRAKLRRYLSIPDKNEFRITMTPVLTDSIQAQRDSRRRSCVS